VYTGQKIKIRLKAYEHSTLDRSAFEIVRTAKRTGAEISGPIPLPTQRRMKPYRVRITWPNQYAWGYRATSEALEIVRAQELAAMTEERARQIIPAEAFIEVYMDCPLELCEQRDPKGMYRKARRGELPEFTGISSPYEPPLDPKLVLYSGEESVAECTERVISYLLQRKILLP